MKSIEEFIDDYRMEIYTHLGDLLHAYGEAVKEECARIADYNGENHYFEDGVCVVGKHTAQAIRNLKLP